MEQIGPLLAQNIGARSSSSSGFTVLVLLAGLLFAVLMIVWTFSRSRTLLDRWAAANGFQLIERQYRWVAKGPYFWRSSRGQTVYRITVRNADGNTRRGYARCGGWVFGLLSDQVDVPVLLSLIRALADFEKLSHQVVVTEAALREHLFGARPYAEAIVARVGGRPAGFALFFHNYSTFVGKPGMYLEDIFVLPESRKGGVGRALLRRVASIARERGCGRFEWSVLDWNENAINFYRRVGAEVLPDWRICRMDERALARLADAE